MTISTVDAEVEVTGSALAGTPLAVAVTVITPAEVDDGTPRVVAFGFPGGGYGRRYWHIHHPAVQGYSQAEMHARRGWVFVACDHLGVGDSTRPDPDALTFDVLAAGNDAAVRSVLSGLRAGTLVAGVGPIAVGGTVGMGQSMGGCLSIVTQARHRTFDALAILGFSAIHTQLPFTEPDGFKWAFHWEDVHPALVDADMGGGYPFREGTVPMWASATVPPVAASMLDPGVVAEDAANIDVPVFVGVGARDVVPEPRHEPAAYRASPDITVMVVPTMAHMHNFASTRRVLWDRLHAWGDAVNERRRDAASSA